VRQQPAGDAHAAPVEEAISNRRDLGRWAVDLSVTKLQSAGGAFFHLPVLYGRC